MVAPEASFAISPGSPTEFIHESCPNPPDPPTVSDFELGLWPALFIACIHSNPTQTAYLPVDGFRATGTPGVIATREYTSPSFSCGDVNPQVQETWELVHTPQTG